MVLVASRMNDSLQIFGYNFLTLDLPGVDLSFKGYYFQAAGNLIKSSYTTSTVNPATNSPTSVFTSCFSMNPAFPFKIPQN